MMFRPTDGPPGLLRVLEFDVRRALATQLYLVDTSIADVYDVQRAFQSYSFYVY